jgi:hypothetical protein
VLYTQGRGDSELDEVFRQANGASTWTFVLEGMDSERTRLVVRWRARWDLMDSPISLLIGVLLDPIEFIRVQDDARHHGTSRGSDSRDRD